MNGRTELDVPPNLLREWTDVAERLRGRRLAVSLDYDGTLTPIVARPDLANLDAPMRETLERLSRVWPTQIISGRGLDDVRRLVGIDTIWYAGSHGLDIAAPRGKPGSLHVAPEIEPEVHRAADQLREAAQTIAGVLVEDKRFAVALHYRLADDAHTREIERIVDDVAARHPSLRKTRGKRVLELRPAVDWDKGKALNWLLNAAGIADALPIYIGDDVTDEDAFAVLTERGVGVVVTNHPRPTAARYSLENPVEVREVLDRLTALGH